MSGFILAGAGEAAGLGIQEEEREIGEIGGWTERTGSGEETGEQ